MKLNLKESSNIKSAYYSNNNLVVTFNSGGTYQYEAVPADVIEQWLAAESVGKAFHSLIKKGSYSYQKMQDVSEVI